MSTLDAILYSSSSFSKRTPITTTPSDASFFLSFKISLFISLLPSFSTFKSPTSLINLLYQLLLALFIQANKLIHPLSPNEFLMF